jgi:hypothetical protein
MDGWSKRHFIMFTRNDRWGTCSDCPRDSEGRVLPELCEYTERSSHKLTIDDLVDQYKRRNEGD